VRRLCVFCGSSSGRDPVYAACARALGVELAVRGVGLVYGGGRVGLMGEVADAALAAGGQVTGVIPQALVDAELAHCGVADLRVVASLHERKALMAELSGGFVALPGGLGTVEELSEVLTWAQLGLHRKPCGVLNVRGYYDAFLALLDRAVTDGFLSAEHRAIVTVAGSPDELLDAFARYEPPRPKWDRPATSPP